MVTNMTIFQVFTPVLWAVLACISQLCIFPAHAIVLPFGVEGRVGEVGGQHGREGGGGRGYHNAAIGEGMKDI